jgi:beta-xylosidase
MKPPTANRLAYCLLSIASIVLATAQLSCSLVRVEAVEAPVASPLLPTAETAAAIWRFTIQQPAAGWAEAGFNDQAWREGKAGFGLADTPNAIIGTEWSTSDIWLRREFSLPDKQPESLALRLHHDEDVEVYFNGKLAVTLAGFTTDYENFPLGPEALTALKPGRNLMAIHCRQTTGGQYIDAGLVQDTGRRPPPPALPDFHADPHIAEFGGTFYIYPTTDMPGWNPPSFECWSSKDLKHWKSEGIILDFARDLKWAKGRAWAPCIASRNGKFYFYYSAEQNIGVAVGDRPQGPFKDPLGKPLVAKDTYQCQVIDPMVFTDDDGSAYFYFGNGNCNVVKLNDDMVSFDPSAVKRITPRDFGEGSFVLKRKGVYYLMWSQYDTRDPRYCVSYATSSSPLGPFTNAANNPILVQSGVVKGAGHHSVVQIPGRDDWVIAYHRFHIPGGDGYHRETCLSPMRFDGQGRIQKVDVFEPAKSLAPGGEKLPGLRKLMDTPLRDTSICRGPDGTWCMTGTVEPFYGFNEGIKVWKSPDLTNWTGLGFVWKYGASPWHKPYLEKRKSLWAPEIHFLKGTFWLTYSMPGWDGPTFEKMQKTSGSGLLRSTSGKPEGPYEDMQPSERLGDEIDASLFQDDDGTVYFLWHSGKIAKLKPDMSGFAEPYRWLKPTSADPNPRHHSGLCANIFGKGSFDHVGYEGMFIFKANGRYHLCCSEIFEGRYSCAISTSTNLFGPYGERYEALPHAGHNTFFKDDQGQWWSTYFGSDGQAPWQERPGVLPIEFDAADRVRAKIP